MNRNQTGWRAYVAERLKSCLNAIAFFIVRYLAARRRRIAQDEEFYRKLNAYCRSNNLPLVCSDDWKTAAYSKDR
jgi:hypothetical protein